MELALRRDILSGQEHRDLRQTLGEAATALIEAHAELRELVRQERAGETDLKPAGADTVKHANLAGHLQWRIERREYRASDQPHLRRALRHRSEKDQRIGAVAAIGLKVVLDLADVGVAEFIGQAREMKCLAEILLGGLLRRIDAGEEVEAELHSSIPNPGVAIPSRLSGRGP
jgi:hypothetical protein